MIVGLRPSSSNTSSIRMWASPRAPPPPSASAIDGRTTGMRRLAHLQGFAGGFHGDCARRDRLSSAPPVMPKACLRHDVAERTEQGRLSGWLPRPDPSPQGGRGITACRAAAGGETHRVPCALRGTAAVRPAYPSGSPRPGNGPRRFRRPTARCCTRLRQTSSGLAPPRPR